MAEHTAAKQGPRHGLEALFDSLPAEAGATWTVRLSPGHGFVNLRGDPGDPEFVTTAGHALGQDLPLEPNTVSDGPHRIYWLGPDEWLVATLNPQPAGFVAKLREVLAGRHVSVTDQSGGFVRLVLSGKAIEDLLAKGCTLDLHPSVFGRGRCAQTALAKASALVARVDTGADGFELYVRRSFADYLVRWLARTGRDGGIGFEVA